MKEERFAQEQEAWFVLAQSVVFGGFDQAIQICRVAEWMNSDRALQLHLEADLLWVSGDKRAHYRYQQAIGAYQKAGKQEYVDALAEHLFLLGVNMQADL